MSKIQFHLIMLPKEPLIGIQLIDTEIHMNDNNDDLTKHRYYGVEIGLLFIRFSYMRIGDQIA